MKKITRKEKKAFLKSLTMSELESCPFREMVGMKSKELKKLNYNKETTCQKR